MIRSRDAYYLVGRISDSRCLDELTRLIRFARASDTRRATMSHCCFVTSRFQRNHFPLPFVATKRIDTPVVVEEPKCRDSSVFLRRRKSVRHFKKIS